MAPLHHARSRRRGGNLHAHADDVRRRSSRTPSVDAALERIRCIPIRPVFARALPRLSAQDGAAVDTWRARLGDRCAGCRFRHAAALRLRGSQQGADAEARATAACDAGASAIFELPGAPRDERRRRLRFRCATCASNFRPPSAATVKAVDGVSFDVFFKGETFGLIGEPARQDDDRQRRRASWSNRRQDRSCTTASRRPRCPRGNSARGAPGRSCSRTRTPRSIRATSSSIVRSGTAGDRRRRLAPTDRRPRRPRGLARVGPPEESGRAIRTSSCRRPETRRHRAHVDDEAGFHRLRQKWWRRSTCRSAATCSTCSPNCSANSA